MFSPRSPTYLQIELTVVKCLVVDNEPAIRSVIAAVLAPLTPEIVECADGAGVLDAFETHQPDVVLMDIAMGTLDGLSATRALRAEHRSACVIIVTNFDGVDLRQAAAAAGASAYVLKDNLLELLPLIARLLR